MGKTMWTIPGRGRAVAVVAAQTGGQGGGSCLLLLEGRRTLAGGGRGLREDGRITCVGPETSGDQVPLCVPHSRATSFGCGLPLSAPVTSAMVLFLSVLCLRLYVRAASACLSECLSVFCIRLLTVCL